MFHSHNGYKQALALKSMGSPEEVLKSEVSGLSAKELFRRGEGVAYADFTILNTRFSKIAKGDISLAADVGKGVVLETPIIASPMDTVTNDRLCAAVALQGAIGAIHYNHKKPDGKTPDVDAQIEAIEAVKRFQNGFIQSPLTISPEMSIQQAIEHGARFVTNGSPIENFPVTDTGTADGCLVGLLRKQDYVVGVRTDCKVRERMLARKHVAVGRWPLTLETAWETLWNERISLLPIVDKRDHLKYLVTRSDMEKHKRYPLATIDEHHRLRVLFAVDTWQKDETCERLSRGFAAGADGTIIDTSQGFSVHEQVMIQHIRDTYPDKLLIGGNVSTAEAVAFLASEGVDAYRCGQGIGSICTTAGAIGISRASASSVYECARAAFGSGMKTIADGGLREVGDIFKALSLGAHCTMLGSMLAGTDESPGETVVDPESGLLTKIYRGMGSMEANVGGKRGYSRLPEGIVRRVKHRGSVHNWMPLIRDGLLHSFEVMNYRNIGELHAGLYSDTTRFERRTYGSLHEGAVYST